MRVLRCVSLSALSCALLACQPRTPPPPSDLSAASAPAPASVEVFPHVWLDAAARTVEVEGWTPIAPGHPNQARVWLEVILCPVDTKEYETLVATEAQAAHVHAALLMLGLEPGEPGAWRIEADGTYMKVPPAGPRVRVEFVYERDGEMIVVDPRTWMIDVEACAAPTGDWLFAGSRLIGREGNIYAADEEGTIVGLSTFGTETLAWSEVHSPETRVEEPVYYANEERLPPFNTPVRVRITPMSQ